MMMFIAIRLQLLVALVLLVSFPLYVSSGAFDQDLPDCRKPFRVIEKKTDKKALTCTMFRDEVRRNELLVSFRCTSFYSALLDTSLNFRLDFWLSGWNIIVCMALAILFSLIMEARMTTSLKSNHGITYLSECIDIVIMLIVWNEYYYLQD